MKTFPSFLIVYIFIGFRSCEALWLAKVWCSQLQSPPAKQTSTRDTTSLLWCSMHSGNTLLKKNCTLEKNCFQCAFNLDQFNPLWKQISKCENLKFRYIWYQKKVKKVQVRYEYSSSFFIFKTLISFGEKHDCLNHKFWNSIFN